MTQDQHKSSKLIALINLIRLLLNVFDIRRLKRNNMIQLQNKKCEFMKKTLQSDSVVLGVSNVDW